MCAGWKESQKVFTDALAELITADSSAYKAAEADAHPLQAAGIRRMLANPQHHDSSYPAAQSASSSLQSNLNVASTAGTAHSLSSLANTHDTAEAAKHNHTSSNGHTSLAEDSARVTSTQIASQFDTCPADDAVSTVCVDRDQPVLTPQPWEEVDQVPGHGLKLQQCQLLNASVCEPSVQMSKQGRGFLVAVYNALGWDRASEPIRVPLDVTAASAAMWVVTGQCRCPPDSTSLKPGTTNADDVSAYDDEVRSNNTNNHTQYIADGATDSKDSVIVNGNSNKGNSKSRNNNGYNNGYNKPTWFAW